MPRDIQVILAAPRSDAHVVALKLLELALEERGYDVLNLGVCRPAGEIAEAAAEAASRGPTAVLLSCQNGHALTDLADLHPRLEALGVAGAVRVYAGGRLAVGAEAEPEAVRRAARALGIHVLDSFEEGFAELERLSRAPACPKAASRAGTRADA